MIGSGSALLDIAKAMAGHAERAQAVATRNLAHADTPGYKAEATESFAAAFAAGRREPNVVLDAAAAADPNGNSVSVEDQVFALSEARGQHDLALALWGQTMGFYRTVLGRGR